MSDTTAQPNTNELIRWEDYEAAAANQLQVLQDAGRTLKAGAENFASLAADIASYAEQLDIKTPAHFEDAAARLKELKAILDSNEADRKAFTGPLDKLKGAVMGLYNPSAAAVKNAETQIKRKLLAFQETERKRAEKLQAEARERARREQERLEKRAQAADDKGKHEKADQLRSEAESTTVPAVISATPEVTGLSTRKVWVATVEDMEAFVKGWLENIPGIRAALIVDNKVLQQAARAFKKDLNWPGVKVTQSESLASRSK